MSDEPRAPSISIDVASVAACARCFSAYSGDVAIVAADIRRAADAARSAAWRRADELMAIARRIDRAAALMDEVAEGLASAAREGSRADELTARDA